MLQLTGNAFVPITCFNTRVRATRAGTFVVPSFQVQIYDKKVTVPAATLEVRADAPDVPAPAQLQIEAEKTNLFVGQPITVRVRVPGFPNGAIQGVQQFQIAGRGLLVDVGAIRQSITPSIVAGRQVPAMTYEATVTPVKAGELIFFAQGFSLSQMFSGLTFSPAQMHRRAPSFWRKVARCCWNRRRFMPARAHCRARASFLVLREPSARSVLLAQVWKPTFCAWGIPSDSLLPLTATTMSCALCHRHRRGFAIGRSLRRARTVRSRSRTDFGGWRFSHIRSFPYRNQLALLLLSPSAPLTRTRPFIVT